MPHGYEEASLQTNNSFPFGMHQQAPQQQTSFQDLSRFQQQNVDMNFINLQRASNGSNKK